MEKYLPSQFESSEMVNGCLSVKRDYSLDTNKLFLYLFHMYIREITGLVASDEGCLKYLGEMRWPDGVVRCPECGSKDVKRVDRSIAKKGKNRRGWFYLCGEKTCGNQFTPTSGTLFHDTHLPLIVWFHAVALMLNGKKGISAKQMQRDLGIGGYKTAWYLHHPIR